MNSGPLGANSVPDPPNPLKNVAFDALGHANSIGYLICGLAGLLALRWLSRWLEGGRWYLFGVYCLIAAAVVGGLYIAGY